MPMRQGPANRKRDRAEVDDDRMWRTLVKQTTRAHVHPKPFPCCLQCATGHHIAPYKERATTLCQAEEREILQLCPKCGLSFEDEKQLPKHFRRCSGLLSFKNIGAAWVKFDNSWFPGIVGHQTPCQKRRKVFPVLFSNDPVPWEVHIQNHEFQLSSTCKKYRDVVGLLTNGTKVEVEMMLPSGMRVWKTGEILEHTYGEKYTCKFGAVESRCHYESGPLPTVEQHSESSIDALGNDWACPWKLPPSYVTSKLNIFEELQTQLFPPSKRRRLSCSSPCEDDTPKTVLIDLEMMPVRVIELPRRQRAVGYQEGWFSFLYWDMTEIEWEDIKRHRQPIALPISLRTIHHPSHPACGGIGAFATTAIKRGAQFCYGGQLTLAGEESTSDYIAVFGESGLDCDAREVGSEMRFVNDHQNTGCSRNVELRKHLDMVTGEISVVYCVMRDICPNEELLASYGRQSYWRYCPTQKPPALSISGKKVYAGARLKVVYTEGEEARECKGTITAVHPSGKLAVHFDNGNRALLPANTEFRMLPAPLPRPTGWPSHIEHLTGYQWDKRLRFRHLYGAHKFVPLHRVVAVLKDCNGQLGLYSVKKIPEGSLLGSYSGRVTRTCSSPAALPFADEFFVVDCGNECRYMRHCFHGGNVRTEIRWNEMNGHPYLALVTTDIIPPSGEMVLDRSLEWQQHPSCYQQLRSKFPQVVPQPSSNVPPMAEDRGLHCPPDHESTLVTDDSSSSSSSSI